MIPDAFGSIGLLYLDGTVLDSVDDYLGSVVSKDNGAQKDIKVSLGNTRGAHRRLHQSGSPNRRVLRRRSGCTIAA